MSIIHDYDDLGSRLRRLRGEPERTYPTYRDVDPVVAPPTIFVDACAICGGPLGPNRAQVCSVCASKPRSSVTYTYESAQEIAEMRDDPVALPCSPQEIARRMREARLEVQDTQPFNPKPAPGWFREGAE